MFLIVGAGMMSAEYFSFSQISRPCFNPWLLNRVFNSQLMMLLSVECVPGFTVRLLSCISQSELITVLTTGLVYCGSYTPSGMPGAQHADTAYQLLHVDKEWWIKIFVRHSPGLFSLHNLLMFALILGVMSLNCEYFLRLSCEYVWVLWVVSMSYVWVLWVCFMCECC